MKKYLLALFLSSAVVGHALPPPKGFPVIPWGKGALKNADLRTELSLPQVTEQALTRAIAQHAAETARAKSTPTFSFPAAHLRSLRPFVKKYRMIPLVYSDNFEVNGVIPRLYYSNDHTSKRVAIDTYLLIHEDVNGELSPEQEAELTHLFWTDGDLSIESLGNQLQNYQNHHYGAVPTLPSKDMIMHWGGVSRPPYGNALQEARLAVRTYMLQKIYGYTLPKPLQEICVLPEDLYKDLQPEELLETAYFLLSAGDKPSLLTKQKITRWREHVKPLVKGQIPLQIHENGQYRLLNPQTTHLMLLDALLTNTYAKDEVTVINWLNAFENLCADTAPTPANLANFKALQQSLQNACWPVLSRPLEEDAQINVRRQEIQQKAERLLNQPVKDLLGNNL